MRIARATLAGVLLASLLVLGGCKKKKPAVPPPQSQAPTITQPQPQPESQPPVPATSEPNRPEPEKQPEATVTPPPPTPKPKPKRVTKPKPPSPAPEKPVDKTAENKPTKTVVTEGGTQPTSAPLSPAVPNEQALHQKQNTSQLLESADYNLKNITRSLSADEQAIVQHIRSYMQQSRDATRDGDTERAYNLALKAHLLCDELMKR